jgi:hypothetical protein
MKKRENGVDTGYQGAYCLLWLGLHIGTWHGSKQHVMHRISTSSERLKHLVIPCSEGSKLAMLPTCPYSSWIPSPVEKRLESLQSTSVVNNARM